MRLLHVQRVRHAAAPVPRCDFRPPPPLPASALIGRSSATVPSSSKWMAGAAVRLPLCGSLLRPLTPAETDGSHALLPGAEDHPSGADARASAPARATARRDGALSQWGKSAGISAPGQKHRESTFRVGHAAVITEVAPESASSGLDHRRVARDQPDTADPVLSEDDEGAGSQLPVPHVDHDT